MSENNINNDINEKREKNKQYQKEYYKNKKKKLENITNDKIMFIKLIHKYKNIIKLLTEDKEDNENNKHDIDKIFKSINEYELKIFHNISLFKSYSNKDIKNIKNKINL